MITTDERIERTAKVPNGRLLVESGYVLAGFGVHRDSDPLDRSNYRVAAQALLAAAGLEPEDLGDIGRPWAEESPELPPVACAHFGHWAVGWVDELIIRADRPELIAAADELLARLAEYPVLDEEDYSEEEYEDNHPGDGCCYSDDPDCSCELPKS